MAEDLSSTTRALLEAFIHLRWPRWKPQPVGGLTPSEMMVLGAAKEMATDSGEGFARLSDLKERLGISAPTLSEQVSSLEAAGYLVRSNDKADRRSVRIALTEKAEARFLAIRAAFAEKFAGLAEWLGKDDAEELVRLLGRIHEYYESAKGESRTGDRGLGREGEGN